MVSRLLVLIGLLTVLFTLLSLTQLAVSAPTQPSAVVVWDLHAEEPVERTIGGFRVLFSPPPPFIDITPETLFLADIVVADTLDTQLREYVVQGGVVVLRASGTCEERLCTERLGKGIVVYAGNNTDVGLLEALRLTYRVEPSTSAVRLGVEYEGPVSPPLGLLRLSGESTIRVLIDREKFVLTLRPGVYHMVLSHVLHDEVLQSYPVSIKRDLTMRLRLLVKVLIYVVTTKNVKATVEGAKEVQSYTVSGYKVSIYEAVVACTDKYRTLLEIGGEAKLPVEAPTGYPYVIVLTQPQGLELVTVKDSQGYPLPYPHVIVEYIVNGTKKIWAWRGDRSGVIALPTEVLEAEASGWRVLSYGTSALPTHIGWKPEKVNEVRYLLAKIERGTFVLLFDERGRYVIADRVSGVSGERYLVARPKVAKLEATVYTAGTVVSSMLTLQEPGKVYYIENLAEEAWKGAALAAIEEAKATVARAELAYKSSAELTAYSLSAEELLKKSREFLKDAEAELLERRYITAKLAAESAEELAAEAERMALKSRTAGAGNVFVLMLAGVLSAISAAAIIFEGRLRIIAAVVFSAIFWTITYMLYPGVSSAFSPSDPLTPRRLLLLGSIIAALCYLVYEEIPSHFEGQNPERAGVVASLAVAFGLATRNLRRRKLRTTLTLFTISVAVFAFAAFVSVGYGVSVVETPPLPSSAKGPALKILSRIRLDEVALVKELVPQAVECPRYMSAVDFELRSGGRSYDVKGVLAVDFERESLVTNIDSIVVEGRLPKGPGYVLISREAARTLGVKPEDEIEVYAAGGTLFLARLRIAGVFSSSAMARLSDVDGKPLRPSRVVTTEMGSGRQTVSAERMIIISASDAYRLWAAFKGYTFYIPNAEEAERVARIVAERIGVPVAVGVNGESRIYYRTVGLVVSGREALVILVISGFVAANALLAAVYERRRELSIYTALGMNPSHVTLTFVAESLLLGMTSVGPALLSALGIATVAVHNPSLMGLRPAFSPEWLGLSVALALVVSVVAGIKPAESASLAVVPSLERRWSFKSAEGPLIVERLPFRIDAHLIERHLEFMKKRIESTYPPHSVLLRTDVKYYKTSEGWVLEITADLVSEGRVSAEFLLKYRPVGKRFYGVTLEVSPLTMPEAHYYKVAYAIADEIRKAMLAWQALYR